MRHKSYSVRKEGYLNTPWDKAYRFPLIREFPYNRSFNGGIVRPPPEVLEFGVNYFILKLEQLGAKTLYSCEGHPNGFYIVFQAPFKIAEKIAFASKGCSTDISITHPMWDHRLLKWQKRRAWRKNCWNMHFMGHGNSYECRNYLLRQLSVQWEKEL